MRLELKPRRAGGGCGLEIVHAPSGSSCDYCLLLHDCILISPCLLSTRHSPRSVYSASLDTSHVPLRPCNNPSNFVDVPSCPSSTRPTSTLDDGDRASRSILRSFAGHISPSTAAKRSRSNVFCLFEDAWYCRFPARFLHSSTPPASHTARQQHFQEMERLNGSWVWVKNRLPNPFKKGKPHFNFITTHCKNR